MCSDWIPDWKNVSKLEILVIFYCQDIFGFFKLILDLKNVVGLYKIFFTLQSFLTLAKCCQTGKMLGWNFQYLPAAQPHSDAASDISQSSIKTTRPLFFLLISWELFLHFTLWVALRCTIHKSPFHQEIFYKYICVYVFKIWKFTKIQLT